MAAKLTPIKAAWEASIQAEGGTRGKSGNSARGQAMVKDLIVHLDVGTEHDTAAEYAISVGATFEAHVAGIAFAFEPVVAPGLMGGIPADFIDAQRSASHRAASAAIARFEAHAKREGISAETRELEATLGGAADLFGRLARRFGLAVVGQAEPERLAAQHIIIEGALFESGRPVIVVPYIQRDPLKLDRVMVCWDGGRAAARAIGDAMPFLERAKAIDVVVVAGRREKGDELAGVDLGQHLARYGLNVEVKRIVADDVDVANTLLSYAADTSADFMVMGGYGHSRLREFVLGGATRGILASMTVPVLMSH
jgi:nucleotide-binding universal stress UspA family protein